MDNNYLVFDIGTTAVKVSILTESLKILRTVRKEYVLSAAGKEVTLSPDIYVSHACAALRELRTTVFCDNILGVAVTTQGETLIPVDRDGNALMDAIVWLDGRADEEADYIRNLISEDKLYKKTGVPAIDGLVPLCKLLYIKNRMPEVYRRTYKFLLLEDYFIYLLTGEFVSEKSLQCTTGWFDICEDCIDCDILKQVGLDPEKLPNAGCPGDIAGYVTEEAAERFCIPCGAPVVLAAMDQVAGAIGAGNSVPGGITETTGTALCIGKTVKKAPFDTSMKIPVYRHYDSSMYLLLPVSMTAGMMLKWYKDQFYKAEAVKAEIDGEDIYDVITEEASRSQPLSGGVLCFPYLSGALQPYFASELRAAFTGIGVGTTRGDMARSVLEGVAFMLRENLELLPEDESEYLAGITSMGGGAKSSLWCEIKAAVTGRPIVVLEESETATIGAAMLIRKALNIQHPLALPQKAVKKEYLPDVSLSKLYEASYSEYQKTLAFLAGEARARTGGSK